MNPFKNSVAIVTGAASGIGRAVSYQLCRLGAFVVAADIDLAGAQKTVRTIIQDGGRAQAALLDVTDQKAVQSLIETVASQQGRLDFVFNNAGIGIAGRTSDMTPGHWRKIVDINLMGVIYGTDAAYRVMQKQGFGHIVNTASLAGLVPTPLTCAYAATKHGVVGLSTSLRYEAALANVRVSVVCPGVVKTEIFERAEVLATQPMDNLQYFPFQMDVTKAARVIIEGVKKNRAVIAFPFSARLTALLYRWFPPVMGPIHRIMIKKFLAKKTNI